MIWWQSECKFGDMIRISFGNFYHYGIFVSEDEVIQFGLPPFDGLLNRKFEDFEENRKLWVDLFNALCELDNNLGRNLFFEYYFLDLNKFLTILNESEDNNSFFENLPKDNFFHISELDWYFVYDRLLSI